MKQKDSITSIISPLVRPGPTEVSYKNMKFLIMDRPTESTLSSFVEELKKRNIRDVVRACEPTYSTDILEKEGIQVHDFQFPDGFPPPQHIIDQWFELCKTRFREDPNGCIAVHCVAGLGRAPVLVALALLELGLGYEEAVDLIRQRRRGAINARQLSYLAEYRPKSRLKVKCRQTYGCLLQ